MKHKQFIDELKDLGVVIVDGTNHYKAYYNGRQSVIKLSSNKRLL